MKINGRQAVGLLLTGAAAGAAVALMYAPKSGVQMRKDVRRFSKKTADRLDDLQDDIREQVGCWAENVTDAFESARKVVEDGRSRLEKILA
jgi:gas vesicle protein